MPKQASPAKYEALGSVDPDEEVEQFPPPNWEATLPKTGCCSRLFFHWITPLILLGKERQINLDDLPMLEAGRLHLQNLKACQHHSKHDRPNHPWFGIFMRSMCSSRTGCGLGGADRPTGGQIGQGVSVSRVSAGMGVAGRRTFSKLESLTSSDRGR